MTALVQSEPRDGDDLAALGSRVADLEARLVERTTEVERAKAGLETFRLRYRQEVGLLHEQLDALEFAIAEAELGELSKLAGNTTGPATEPPTGPRPEPAPRFTSDAVRKLFRDVAKAIHPDLAADDGARDRRHRLMVEANRAYALGDEQHLRSILHAWERSPDAVPASDPEALRLRLVRRVSQVEEQLDGLASELAALQDSALWTLKAMVDAAAARGKDIVRDMVQRLKRDIMAATNRLDAMRPPQ